MVTFVVTLVASIFGSLPVFALGLIVHEAVSNSLTIMVVGLLAAISSSWLSNLFRIGGMRSRLLHIVATSEIVASILALAYFLVTISPAIASVRRLFPANIFLLGAWGVLLTTSACFAAWRFRSPTRNLKRDAIMSLVLPGLAIVAIVATMAIASLFGLTGA
ncbi:MAG: hypothetical protein Q8Q07_01490 [Dehalococcoidales bacterium]|nr:hypothetical protein [Dehalococcoidales bacterium]